jgi:hypothetical protein
LILVKWRLILLTILLVLPTSVIARPTTPTLSTGETSTRRCTVPSAGLRRLSGDLAALQDGLASAQGSGARCLYLAGLWTLPPVMGALLAVTVDHVEIYGDGEGKTILQYPDNVVYTQTNAILIQISAVDVQVHDLSIRNGANPTGTGNWWGVSCTLGCLGAHLTHLEVAGAWGTDTAGGEGIDLYQPWNSGAGWQGAVVADNYIHDSPAASGIVLASTGNTLERNRIEDVGNTATRHGIYAAGGNNRVIGNRIVRAGGYSLHFHKQTPNLDAAADIIEGNTSIDPEAGHLVIDTYPNERNPAFPPGFPLDQGDLIEGNTFLGTVTATNGIGVWANGVPVRVVNNLFRDASVGYSWLDTHLAPGHPDQRQPVCQHAIHRHRLHRLPRLG